MAKNMVPIIDKSAMTKHFRANAVISFMPKATVAEKHIIAIAKMKDEMTSSMGENIIPIATKIGQKITIQPTLLYIFA